MPADGAGQAMTAEALRKGGWKQMPQAGWGSVSVPGAADGYFALHERFGSKRFADLVEPAACYAAEGVAVSQKAAQFWRRGRIRNYSLSKESMEQYLVGGQPPKPGEIFRQPKLARTWRELGKHGRQTVLRRLVCRKDRHCLRCGWRRSLTASDLAAQHCVWVQRLPVDYRGHRVMEMPPKRSRTHRSPRPTSPRRVRYCRAFAK